MDQTLVPRTVFLEEIITQEICDEIMPLLQKHWDEVSHPAFKDFQVLKPDFDKYIAAGMNRGTGKPSAVLFTIREIRPTTDEEKADKSPSLKWQAKDEAGVSQFVAGRLVGYWAFFINDTLHYKGTTQAMGDVLFVEKEYRGKVAYEFAQQCVEQLKEGGVQVVHAYCKKAHDLTRLFVDGMGFEVVDLHFTKRLA